MCDLAVRLRPVLVACVFAAASSCGGSRFSSSGNGGGSGGSAGGNASESGGGDAAGGTTSTTTTNAGGSSVQGTGGVSSGGTENAAGGLTSSGGAGGNGTTTSAGRNGAGGTTTAAGGATATGGNGTGGRGTGGSAGTVVGEDAGPTTRWCHGQNALFCEDFDDITTIDELVNSWTNVSTTGGTFNLDNSAGVPSAPNALRVRTTAASSVQALAIQKLAPFASRPSKIRMEFEFRIDAADNVDFVSGAAFAGILTGSHVTDGIIGLEAGTGPALYSGYIASDGSDAEAVFSTPWPPENQWLGRFAIEVTYASSATGVRTGCVQIYVAGVKQLPTCQKLSPLLVDPPFVSVVLGIYSGGLGTTGDIQLRFDNITLNAQ